MRNRGVVAGVWMVGAVAFISGCAEKRERGAAPDKGSMTGAGPGVSAGRVSPRPVGGDLRSPRWPAGYVQRKTVRLDPGGVARIGKALGGRLTAVTNYFVHRGRTRLQANVIEAATPEVARKVVRNLRMRSFAGRERFGQRGRFVVELMGDQPATRHQFIRDMGLLDKSVRRYRVTARYGLLRTGDAADVNVLFNLVLRPRPDNAQWTARMAQLRKTMRFGKVLVLRSAPTAAGRPIYRLTPAPVKTQSAGVATRFTFGAVPKLHGVPYVDLIAQVATRGWTATPSAAASPPALTAATPAWPTRDAAIQKRVREVIAGHKSGEARLRALHRWVHRNIRHAGRQGSRDGVLAVLKRGFGRCGDSADVMITLARAAGLGARLVAGWIVGGPGHFWAEVHVAPKGWISVDATAPWIGVSGDYVPLMISTDGTLPLMHLRLPGIERIPK
jgi:transglutaminase-like putative cysteine protease